MAANIQLHSLYQPGILSRAQDKQKLDSFLILFANAIAKGDTRAAIARFKKSIEYTYLAQFSLQDSKARGYERICQPYFGRNYFAL